MKKITIINHVGRTCGFESNSAEIGNPNIKRDTKQRSENSKRSEIESSDT